METVTFVHVQSQEIDELGHVNNSVYLKYLEKGRQTWYKEAAGLTYQDMINNGTGTVLIKVEILFKKEAVVGEQLRVMTAPNKKGNTSYEFKQIIKNQHDEIIVDANVLCVMIDLTKRKSRPLLESIARHFNGRLNA